MYWAVDGPFPFLLAVPFAFAAGGAGRMEPMRRPLSLPWVSTFWLSEKFRRTSWILPSLLASASFSASSGVTAMVTVFTVTGLLSFCSTICPAARTWTSWRNVLETCSCCRSGETAVVTTTSTRESGTMKPPTPTTSFTLTLNARMPSGTFRERRPELLSVGTSFDSTIGSPRKNSRKATRPSAGLTALKASLGWRSLGHEERAIWLELMVVPSGMSTTATATPTVSSFAFSAIRFFSERNRYAPRLATRARQSAKATIPRIRFRSIMQLPSEFFPHGCGRREREIRPEAGEEPGDGHGKVVRHGDLAGAERGAVVGDVHQRPGNPCRGEDAVSPGKG